MAGASERAKALIAEASGSGRLYPLRTHDAYGFYTGCLPHGEQAIVFWDSPGQVAVLMFNTGGDYLGAEVHEIGPLPDLPRSEDLRCQAVHEHLQAAFGLIPGPVCVGRFLADRWQVGIRPVEDFHEEFANDPESFCGGDAEGIVYQLD